MRFYDIKLNADEVYGVYITEKSKIININIKKK